MNARTLPSAPAPAERESEPTPVPAPEPGPGGFIATLLAEGEAPSWIGEARRLGIAASLAAVFGLSLGLRHGGLTVAAGAAGVPLGILSVCAVAAPALVILLALANAPIGAHEIARATTRSAAKAGLLLAGIAPAAALFVATVEDAITVTLVGYGSLVLAGVVAAHAFLHELSPHLAKVPPSPRIAMTAAVWAFLVFAGVLAIRVWGQSLPMLLEAS